MKAIFAAAALAAAAALPAAAVDGERDDFRFGFTLSQGDTSDRAAAAATYERLERQAAQACRVARPGSRITTVDRDCQRDLINKVVSQADRRELATVHSLSNATRTAQR